MRFLTSSQKQHTIITRWLCSAVLMAATLGDGNSAAAEGSPYDVQGHVQRMMQERYQPDAAVPAPRRRLVEPVAPSVSDRNNPVDAAIPVSAPDQGRRPATADVRIWGKPVSALDDGAFAERTQQQLQELQDVKASAARLAQEKLGDHPVKPRQLETLTDLLPKAFVPDTPPVVMVSPPVPPPVVSSPPVSLTVQEPKAVPPSPVQDRDERPKAVVAEQPVLSPAPKAEEAKISAQISVRPEVAPAMPPVPAIAVAQPPKQAPLQPINFGQIAASDLKKAAGSSAVLPPAPPPAVNAVSQAADAVMASEIRPKNIVQIGQTKDDLDFIRKLTGNNGIIAMDATASTMPPDMAEPVRLEEAVAFALKNNLEVRALSEKSRGAYWDKIGNYAQFVPSVEMSYSYGAESSSPASVNDANGDRLLDSTHHRRDRNMSVRQPLIDLAILADIRSGIDKEDVVKIDEIEAREGIASDTVGVYLKLMQARIAVRLAEQYQQYLDDLAARMEARVAGGGGTMADLDRIRSRATVAESAKVEASGDYESSLAEFRRLTKIVPAQLMVPDVLAPDVPPSYDIALGEAIKANPAYLSSLKKIDVAADDRNKSLATMLPKLSLQYQKNFSHNAGASDKGNPVDGVYPSQRTESVMLVAQWSLNSGTPIASSLSGMAKKREMRFRADDVRARLEQTLRASFTAVNAANQRQEIVRKSVEANERVVDGFEDQYRQGGRSLFELLDAYEQLYNSRLNLLRLIVARAQAMYQIRKQMGQLIPTVAQQAGR